MEKYSKINDSGDFYCGRKEENKLRNSWEAVTYYKKSMHSNTRTGSRRSFQFDAYAIDVGPI